MQRFSIIFVFLLITLLASFVYSNSFNVPFQFDDVKRIVDIKAAEVLDVKEIFQYSKTRFFLYLTLAFNFYLGGHNVFGYHLFNLIVHILSSFLVFLLCLFIFNSPKGIGSNLKKDRYLLSLFSALIFAVHPLQTQAVTYIWQRGESMAGMFYFLSLVLYAKFRLEQIYSPVKKGRTVFYILCLISIMLCSLTKPTSLTLPVAILLYEACFLSKGMKEFKKNLLYLVPILACLVFPILLARYDIGENKNVGVRLASYYMPYYYTKLRVLVDAIRLMVVPINQRVEYDFVWSLSLGEPISTFYSLVFLLGLVAIAILRFKSYPLVSFGIGWFYLTVFGTTILYLEYLFFEHYLYLPLLSYVLILPVSSFSVMRKIHVDRKWCIVFLVALIAVYSIGSYNRNKVWQTEVSLWEDTVKKSPYNARANYTLGVYYFREERYKEALERYKVAIRNRPNYSDAYYRLGEYYFALGDIETSIANYKKAIEINPEFFEAHINLGSVYLYSGQRRDARESFNRALRFTRDPVYIKKINDVLREIGRHE